MASTIAQRTVAVCGPDLEHHQKWFAKTVPSNTHTLDPRWERCERFCNHIWLILAVGVLPDGIDNCATYGSSLRARFGASSKMVCQNSAFQHTYTGSEMGALRKILQPHLA